MGIEPTLVAWEATVLPLNYTREITCLDRHHCDKSKAAGVGSARLNQPIQAGSNRRRGLVFAIDSRTWLPMKSTCRHYPNAAYF